MKVLIIRGFPDILNLQSYNVQEVGLAGALRRRGILCDIALYNGRQASREEVLEDGTKVYWLRGTNLAKNGLLHGIRRVAAGYDLVQVHEYDQLQSWLVYTFWKKPAVIYHGPYEDAFNRGYNLKTRVFDRTLLPLAGRRGGIYCAAKSPMAEDFLRARGFEKARTLGVGLDERKLAAPDPSVAVRMPENRLHVLYVGKLEERRNARLLPEIFREIRDRLPAGKKVFFTVVGRGEPAYEREILEAFRPMEEAGDLLYVPRATQSELAAVYGRADVFLFPSNYDIFGMVLLEAMYAGCVCISSRNGGSAALIEEGANGRILEDFDPGHWADAAISLLTDEKTLSRMKERARKTVAEGFVWDALAGRFEELYRDCLEEAPV